MEIRPLPQPIVELARDENARLGVPGAAIGVLHDGVCFVAGVGVTNVEHPLPVTPETVFQIGSTSKTFTATALMQLVETGRVNLAATVRTYLPEFRLQSESEAARVTVFDLVTHHAGYVGDYFRDTGRGDDAIAKIVAKMAGSPQLVPAGTTFSYSNAAFYVLGHIIERTHGQPFERVVHERIFAPLEMHRSFYFPEECIPHRVAAGHIVTQDGPKVARRWHTPRSIAPGGGITSNVIDQMRYAALHVGAVGKAHVLSAHSIDAMQQKQREAGSMCDAIGISWMLDDAGDGRRLVKHGGATNGQLSSFELVPEEGFAVTVLTNSDTGRESRQTIADCCQQHFLGFGKPQPRALSPASVNLAEYAGEFRATLAHLRVVVEGERLCVHETAPVRTGGEVPLPLPPAQLSFSGVDRTVVLEGPRKGERVEFLRGNDKQIEWLRWDGRIARRQNDE